jgi:oxazoline/thiazoline synthase
MLQKPEFKSRFRVEKIEPDDFFLVSEEEAFLLAGKVYQLVVPLINGQNTADEIAESLKGKIATAEVYYVLMHLEQKGYVTEADANVIPSSAAFWETLKLNPQTVAERIKTTNVSIKTYIKESLSDQLIDKLTESLKSLQIQVDESGTLEVVLTDDYLNQSLSTYNQKALRSKRPWMLVKPVGNVLWFGPIFNPGQTGCWQCLASRLKANRPVESFIENCMDNSFSFATSIASLPTTQQIALSIAATFVGRWLAHEPEHPLLEKLITFDSRSLENQSHVLVKRPQCVCCGEIILHPNREPTPITIQSCQKEFTSDGGHRSCSPEKTFQKYKRHISSISGVIRALNRISPSDSPWNHTYEAGHHFFNSCKDLKSLRANFHYRSGGKGRTDSQAKVSALCESIERYSGVFQGTEIRKIATYHSIKNHAIHPNTCTLFSEKQYQNRREWNLKSPPNHIVPEPFNPEQDIEWTPVWSMTENKFKYLPTAYCYYGYRGNHLPFCYGDSNGNAAGNTLEEAIFQGFMELVERDAVAIWWYNRVRRPGVDLNSFKELYFASLQESYAYIGRSFWVLDITTDLGIPVFVAISHHLERPEREFIYGFGSHFDPKLAILRAITELNQSLTRFSQKTSNDNFRDYDNQCQNSQTEPLIGQSYLFADISIPKKTYKDYDYHENKDLFDDIHMCINIVKDHGMEMLVLDQTRLDLDLKVVKVIVPGLRHFWKRMGPGRLYDVPSNLGWLLTPNLEIQLNSLLMES